MYCVTTPLVAAPGATKASSALALPLSAAAAFATASAAAATAAAAADRRGSYTCGGDGELPLRARMNSRLGSLPNVVVYAAHMAEATSSTAAGGVGVPTAVASSDAAGCSDGCAVGSLVPKPPLCGEMLCGEAACRAAARALTGLRPARCGLPPRELPPRELLPRAAVLASLGLCGDAAGVSRRADVAGEARPDTGGDARGDERLLRAVDGWLLARCVVGTLRGEGEPLCLRAPTTGDAPLDATRGDGTSLSEREVDEP